jgi:hypothetical protein
VTRACLIWMGVSVLSTTRRSTRAVGPAWRRRGGGDGVTQVELAIARHGRKKLRNQSCPDRGSKKTEIPGDSEASVPASREVLID